MFEQLHWKPWKKVSAVLAGAILLGAASGASATPITGGSTTVAIDETIAGVVTEAGVSLGPVGSATLDGLTFSFPITGGELSDEVIPGSTIEHEGSGIAFTAGATALTIGDFLIDTSSLLISGFAMSMNPAEGPAVDLGGVPLFGLSLNAEEGLPFVVSLTDAAASTLNATFGVDLFQEGLAIGTAATAPSTVPEPGAAGLLGLGAIALFLRRRRSLQRP